MTSQCYHRRLFLPPLWTMTLLLLSLLSLVSSFTVPFHHHYHRIPTTTATNTHFFGGYNHNNNNGNRRTTTNLNVVSYMPGVSRPTTEEDGMYYSSDVDNMTSDSKSLLEGRGGQRVTLTRYLSSVVQDHPELRDIESLLGSVKMACKTISNLVNRAGINHLSTFPLNNSDDDDDDNNTVLSQYDMRLNSMKKLDQLSTNVLRNALRFTGKLQMVAPAKEPEPIDADNDNSKDNNNEKSNVDANNNEQVVVDDTKPSQHQPGVLIASGLDSRYVACFDPLDGSGNADAAICTGTIFGVFETPDDDESDDDGVDNVVVGGGDGTGQGQPLTTENLVQAVLQPGKNLRAAGYCLYSSATILVFTLGEGTHGFTLDPQINEFILTHPNIRIPGRGNVYSCNEANSEYWDEDLTKYLKALKTGTNQTGRKYASRYVGSMVGDIHRTLMYGGIFCYPSDSGLHPKGNLQLLYKTSPMGYIIEQAGGKCTNGKGRLLDVKPERVHERSPCFIGSPEDIDEMMSYIKHE